MTIKSLPLAAVAVTILVSLSLPAGSDAQANRRAAPAATVTATAEGGMRMGNDNARAALVEYVSYTCPHCATYDAQSHEALRRQYVARGTTSVEVRPLVRDALDLATAVVARCGTPARFFERHHALMARQQDMFAAAQTAQSGWAGVPTAQRLARIADDTGVIAAVAPLGVTEVQARACLADEAAVRRIVAIVERGSALGVRGTPSFLLNGQLLDGVHNWAALQPRLDAALAAR